jgi:putative restriction endonuclease
MIDTGQRLFDYPFALESELRDSANGQGYRIAQGQAAGWLFYSSTSAPGEIAVAATASGVHGPFFLSVAHPGAARELKAESAGPCAKGHAAAFAFATRDALFAGVSAVYRLSLSLPTLPYEDFIRETAHLGDTEAERAQKVRIGQDRFRGAIVDYWNGTCPFTGVTDPQLLRASHIIPWAACESDQERLNVHNGLLLSSLWDAAFDSGLITFNDEGYAIASPHLSNAAQKALALDRAPPLHLVEEQISRLAWHRKEVWVRD